MDSFHGVDRGERYFVGSDADGGAVLSMEGVHVVNFAGSKVGDDERDARPSVHVRTRNCAQWGEER